MNKQVILEFAAVMGKAMAVAFFLELERRLGKTRYGSLLGLLGNLFLNQQNTPIIKNEIIKEEEKK